VLVICAGFIVFKFDILYIGAGGSSRGLAPTPWSYSLLCDCKLITREPTVGVVKTVKLWAYAKAPRPGPNRKGLAHSAWPYGGHSTLPEGVRAQEKGLGPIL
jgi:hypothetical protein